MSDEKFKLPRSSYEELVKIIKAYGHFNEPQNLEEISKLSVVGPTVVSANNGFLINTEIIGTGAKKQVMPKGKALAQALEHAQADETRKAWKTVILENDFLSKVLTSVRIRSGMDEETLQGHIAYSAGEPKKPPVMTGAKTIIDILRAAELIKEVDGKLVVNAAPASNNNNELKEISDSGSATQTSNIMAQEVKTLTTVQGVGIQLTINLQINCEPADLEGLGTKIKAVIEEVQYKNNPESGA